MIFFLRFMRLLSLVIWVGGIVFFAFVVAPVAFHGLPSGHEAGIVVRGSLLALHWIGIACGVVFAGATVLLPLRLRVEERGRALLLWQIGLIGAMVIVTVVSQRVILPAMEADRQAGGGVIEALGVDDARRVDFERMHVLSERMEGAVLLLGLGAVGLVAREDGRASPTEG